MALPSRIVCAGMVPTTGKGSQCTQKRLAVWWEGLKVQVPSRTTQKKKHMWPGARLPGKRFISGKGLVGPGHRVSA